MLGFRPLHTEATAHTMWNMSDRGIPRSYRMMEGFGSTPSGWSMRTARPAW
ncbi:catalase [Rhodococcus hoagii]|nr:catalase [Prescottella equi]